MRKPAPLRCAGLHNLLPVIWRLYFHKLTKLNIQFLSTCILSFSGGAYACFLYISNVIFEKNYMLMNILINLLSVVLFLVYANIFFTESCPLGCVLWLLWTTKGVFNMTKQEYMVIALSGVRNIHLLLFFIFLVKPAENTVPLEDNWVKFSMLFSLSFVTMTPSRQF